VSENTKLLWWIAFVLAIIVVVAYWPHHTKARKQPEPGLQGPLKP